MAFEAPSLNYKQICPIFVDLDNSSECSLAAIKDQLEDGSNSKKIAALEQTILQLLRGEDVSPLLMTIIRFVLPSNHHRLKKLVYLFFQVFDMRKPDGSVREESILVCNVLRNDLCSPNEYVRGSALRLLSKIRHWNIVQPMIPSILENLKHEEPYVHKNALLCAAKIAEKFGSDCMATALEEAKRILVEGDPSAKVKAFNLLVMCDPSMAIQYILSIEESLLDSPPSLHLAIISSFFNLASISVQVRTLMLRVTIMLLENSSDNAVRFAGSSVISRLRSTPIESRKVAANSLVRILLEESDLNLKLIVISRLNTLYFRSSSAGDAPNVLESYVMDIMRTLNSSSRQVTLSVLSLVLRSLSRQNVDDLLQSFKKEFTKANEIATYSAKQAIDYRILLVKAIHYTCGIYPERCGIVYDTLLGYLNHHHAQTAADVASFFKRLIEIFPGLRDDTIRKLLKVLNTIPHSDVLSVCFWVIGEYCTEEKLAVHCCDFLFDLLSPYPFLDGSKAMSNELKVEKSIDIATKTVLEDGNHKTEVPETAESKDDKSLRKLLISRCDPLLYSCISQFLLKLVSLSGEKESIAKATLIVGNLVQLLQTPHNSRVYSNTRPKTIFTLMLGLLKDTKKYQDIVKKYIKASKYRRTTPQVNDVVRVVGSVEKAISFSTILGEVGEDDWIAEEDSDFFSVQATDDFDIDSILDIGPAVAYTRTRTPMKKHSEVHQFTSLMDPLYVESTVGLVGKKIYLTLYLKNTSGFLLQNIRVEVCSGESLEILSTVPVITLPIGGCSVVQLLFKIKCSEDDNICGHVYFDQSKSGIQECISFNPMRICMFDYVTPSFVSPTTFRSYWTDFEWEHKIQLYPIMMEPLELLRRLLEATHMTVVTPSPPMSIKNSLEFQDTNDREFFAKYMTYLKSLPEVAALVQDSSFFAVNLFVRTICDEEALANLSVVKNNDGMYTGCFRIRSRTQRVALGLGDRVTCVQCSIL